MNKGMKIIALNYQTTISLLAGLILLCLPCMTAVGQEDTSNKWNGTSIAERLNMSGDTILIASAAELAYLAQQVNSGTSIQVDNYVIQPDGKLTSGGFSGYIFALTKDIDLNSENWTPIGNNGEYSFKGHFDGRGHCVSGLKIDIKDMNNKYCYAGLFGEAIHGTIKNMGVRLSEEGIRAIIEVGHVYAGGLAARVDSVYNCYVEGPGKIEATSESKYDNNDPYSLAGGIAGELTDSPVLSHCYSTVDVKAVGPSKSGGVYAGGIAGRLATNGSISNAYATGTVEATGPNSYAGGICGYVNDAIDPDFQSSISNCLALNDSVKNNSSAASNRIVGGSSLDNTVLTDNYASSEMLVNGYVVSDEDNKNGNSSITSNNLQKTLGDTWKEAWTFPDDGYLPQIKQITGDKGDKKYTEWPTTSPQSFIDPVANLPGKIADSGSSGNAWNDSILIASRTDLAYLAKQVNAGKNLVIGDDTIKNDGTNIGFQNIYFALSKDIDLSHSSWTPIGNSSHPFCGNFDGQGHRLTGLKVKIDAPDETPNDTVYAGFSAMHNRGRSATWASAWRKKEYRLPGRM